MSFELFLVKGIDILVTVKHFLLPMKIFFAVKVIFARQHLSNKVQRSTNNFFVLIS
jgi:hypothetical protein